MKPYRKELFGEFIRNVVQASSTMTLYSREHRTTIAQASRSLLFFQEALADDEAVTIMKLGTDLFVGSLPLDKGPQIDRFLQAMTAYGLEHITIGRGATYDDIELLLLIVAQQAERDPKPTDHLRFGAVSLGTSTQTGSPGIQTSSAIPPQFAAGLERSFRLRSNSEKLDLDAVLGIVAGFVAAFRGEANPFLALVPLRESDEYSFTHSINVCILNLAQGMSLGFEGQLLHDLGVAGLLHDVGKQFVPEEILKRPGKLDENEWEAMRQHAVRGAEYLLNNPGIPRIAVLCAFEHHMKFDMSGYPRVPEGWQTSLCSQITALSDFFDALRTRRVYRDAMTFEKTAGIMLRLAGTDFNPSLALNFLRILRNMQVP